MSDVANTIAPINELTKGLPPSSAAIEIAAIADKQSFG
jgi:hypothetical protein